MWKCSGKVGSEQWAVSSAAGGTSVPCWRRVFVLLLTAHCLLLTTSCRVDMQDQPKMKPYRSSPFYKDGLSSRQLVPGTVPRGWLREDKELFTGKKAGNQAGQTQGAAAPKQNPETGPVATPPLSNASASQVAAAYPDDVDKFPFPISQKILERGEQRYQIFCTVCHGPTGSGDGMIVRRGFRKPPSFHDQNLRAAPVGHYFDVATNGWGAMPSYAAQIPVQDRWAIIAYIRALQLTRPATPAAAASSQTTSAAKPTSGGQK